MNYCLISSFPLSSSVSFLKDLKGLQHYILKSSQLIAPPLFLQLTSNLTVFDSRFYFDSDSHKRRVEMCYNIFGFYIQFLPV